MDNEVFKVYNIAYTNQYKTNARVYEVSNLGRVKCNGEIVEPYMNGKYLYIGTFFIHRAVAELFIANPENKPQVDHINTDRLDNRAENLRWVTHKENCNNTLTRKHISEVTKGRVLTAEWKRKLSEAHKGRTLSEEHRAKLRAARQGLHWKLVDGKRTYYEK